MAVERESSFCVAAMAALGLLLALAAGPQRAQAWFLFGAPAAPTRAQALFDMDGVKGAFNFSQAGPGEPTRIDYDLAGLQGNNNLYHVHVRPVPQYDPAALKDPKALAGLCADPATGGHHNPHNVNTRLKPGAPLDQYELGDLSGKHGPLKPAASQPDRYLGSHSDTHLPLSGPHSILGRSVVIHKNDGKRWVCASIVQLN